MRFMLFTFFFLRQEVPANVSGPEPFVPHLPPGKSGKSVVLLDRRGD